MRIGCYILIFFVICFQSILIGQSHRWIDSNNPNNHRTELSYSDARNTEGAMALKISGDLATLSEDFSLDQNTLEIKLAENLSQAEDWSIHKFVTLDIYMEENPTGLSEARLTLFDSKGDSTSTSLILGWQLYQWENHQMTFPLEPNAYNWGNVNADILKDVVNVSLAFNRYSDEGHAQPYKKINFHIDNMRLDGHLMWDDFEQNNIGKEPYTINEEQLVYFTPKNSKVELSLNYANGAIAQIKDLKYGKVFSNGNLEGVLWEVVFLDESGLTSLNNLDFDINNPVYRFEFDAEHQNLKYHLQKPDGKYLSIDIHVEGIEDGEIEFKASLENRLGQTIRKFSLAEKLSVKTNELKQALWPIQEGMILLPRFFEENRSSVMARPPMFADLLAIETKNGTLGIYLIQDEQFHKDLIPHHPVDAPVFQPANLCIGGEGDSAYMYFDFLSIISHGENWVSPSMRICVDRDFKALAQSYRNTNGFNDLQKFPSLQSKIGNLDQFEKFKESPIYAIEMYKTIDWQKSAIGETWATIQNDWLPKLEDKGILHLTHWQYGRDIYEHEKENHKLEDSHPDALPIWWDRYGSEAAFHELLTAGKAQGFSFMPFTNWTVWNKLEPNGAIVPLDFAPWATRKIRGESFPFMEYKGYMVKPWHDEVRKVNDEMMSSLERDYRQDYVFVDMTGERSIRYILTDSGRPSSVAYTQSVINENVRLAKQQAIFTEGVFDRISNSVTGYAQSYRQKFWNGILNHIGAEFTHWAPYPLAASILHDKSAFYQHNLNQEIWAAKSDGLLSYYVAMGYNMMIDLSSHINEDERTIHKLAKIQKLICSQTMGASLYDFEYMNKMKTVYKTIWGEQAEFEVVANFEKDQSYPYNNLEIAPNGFYGKDKSGNIEGGIFVNQYNGKSLSPGVHCFILERQANKISAFYLDGPGTDLMLAIPQHWNEDDLRAEIIYRNNETAALEFKLSEHQLTIELMSNSDIKEIRILSSVQTDIE